MEITYLLEQPKTRCREIHILKNFPNEYQGILKCEGEKFVEKLYNYIYKSPQHTCPVCGKETPFKNFISGHSQYCSVKCSANDDVKKEKAKTTMLEKYGVENISQLDSIKQQRLQTMETRYGKYFNNRKKAKTTMLEKYGVENISQLDSIKQQRLQTMETRYGKYFNNQEKAKTTMLEKYGYKSTLSLPEVRKKALDTKREKFLFSNDDIIEYMGDSWMMKCPHPECNKCEEKTFIIKQGHYHDRLRIGAEVCTKLLPVSESKNSNTSLEIFIKQILDSHNIKYISNDRKILEGKELDIYIPDKKIAVECNGCYWHNDFRLHLPKKHYNKWKICKENEIQLLTIWEDWIVCKPALIQSIIETKLGICNNRLYARKCNIIDLSSNKTKVKDFLKENHIQGNTPFEKCFGLVYNDEIISVMTFGHKRGCRGGKQTNGNEWELSRFCNKMNTVVIGGAGKLLKHFEKMVNPEIIYSYSSNDISNGNLYKKLDFKEDSISIPYWYVEPKTLNRYHRTSFTKREIMRKGMTSDTKFTESEIMKKYNFLKIYDSGMTKWIKHL